jgi:hypothetical protein
MKTGDHSERLLWKEYMYSAGKASTQQPWRTAESPASPLLLRRLPVFREAVIPFGKAWDAGLKETVELPLC